MRWRSSVKVMSQLLLTYYADDFTGATDALECLAMAGVRTALFIDMPTPDQLQKQPGLQAIGVAGSSRALATASLESELRASFAQLGTLRSRYVHYKICSTFDSSPEIGSIGRALDIGCELFQACFVPLVIAAPALGRYCTFGNLFARMGIGSNGQIHRLDRHPATRNHPITPALESDLRMSLAKQTNQTVGLFNVLQYELSQIAAAVVLDELIGENTIILFDALYPEHLERIGSLIDARVADGPQFCVGSSAIETALVSRWGTQGLLAAVPTWPQPAAVDELLVLSGSCSPVTEKQIHSAVEHGFVPIAVDTGLLLQSDRSAAEVHRVSLRAIESLDVGRSVIVHTGLGPHDPRVAATRSLASQFQRDAQSAVTETCCRLGQALGEIGRRCLEHTRLRRICIAGGDTSSHVARALEIESLEMVAPLTPGAPLCRARSPSISNGLELIFKGGQVGDEGYFECARCGKSSPQRSQ